MEAIYETRVFFIRTLGFVTATEARRISLEDTLRFEKVHEDTYGKLGFELISVEPAPLVERVSIIKTGDWLDVNAIDVVHSGVSGNNEGYHTNPSFLEALPNESSS